MEEFDIRSSVTLSCENLIGEIREHGDEMPLVLPICHLFNRLVNERTKRLSNTMYSYHTSRYSKGYQFDQQSIPYGSLPKMRLPKQPKQSLSKLQITEMKEFASDFRSQKQKTVRNMSTKDTTGTLPLVFYKK